MIPSWLLQKATNKGSEEQYYAWLRQCVSFLVPVYSEYVNGEGRCVVAHVRSGNAGTAYKPPYSAVPLTQLQHGKQHQHGYEYYLPIERWIDASIKYLKMWVNDEMPTKESKKVKFELLHANQLRALHEIVKDGDLSKPHTIEFYKTPNTRSLKQNNAMWKLYSQLEGEFKKDSDKWASFISKYLSYAYDKIADQNLSQMIHEIYKFRFNKKTTTKLRKHNDNYEDSYEEYMHEIIHDVKKYGIYLDMPSKDLK